MKTEPVIIDIKWLRVLGLIEAGIYAVLYMNSQHDTATGKRTSRVPAKQIARLLGITHLTVMRHLHRLEMLGWIEIIGEDDRRVKTFSLNEPRE